MQRPNLYDYIKIVALLSMIIDHLGYFVFPDEIWLRIVGRLAFPLFLLLVGYNWSYRTKKRLRIIWLLLQAVIWWWMRAWVPLDPVLNILLAIALTRVVLWQLTKQSIRLQIAVCVVSILLASKSMSFVDYWTWSLVFWLVWRRMRAKSMNRTLPIAYLLVVLYIFFMVSVFPFPENTWIYLWWVVLLLCVLMTLLAKQNTVLRITPRIDAVVLWISSNALRLYCLQWILLIVLLVFVSK